MFQGMFVIVAIVGHISSESGNTEDYWRSTSVIVAKVSNLDFPHGGPVDGRLVLQPIATLGGNVDASKYAELTVSVIFAVSAIDKTPKSGDTVVVVLRRSETGYIVTEDNVEYLPARCGLNIVDNLDSKEFQACVEGVKKARAKARKAFNEKSDGATSSNCSE